MSELSESKPLPFYAKFSLNLIAIFLIGILIYIGSGILLPLFFSLILAILLIPLSNRLTRLGLPEVLSMLLAILLALLAISGIIYFLSAQIADFANDWPSIQKHLEDHGRTVQHWVSEQFGISRSKQDDLLQDATSNMQSSGGSVIGTTIFSAAGSLINIILLPIYTFLFMYYRKLIRKFFKDSFREDHHQKVEEVMQESKSIIVGYMVGLLIEMAVVTGLNAGGFFAIGIQYALFLALLSAILNMIPYVGMLVASIICMLITLTTSDSLSDVLWVGVILVAVQFLDNNFLMPYIVGNKVRINAMANIVGVLVGGALAGVGGMFLSIPGVAILKTVFERVDGLKPWGLLLGDDLSMVSGKKRNKLMKISKNDAEKENVTAAGDGSDNNA